MGLFRSRSRPVLLEKEELLNKAIAVARTPSLANELPENEREQVNQVVKALSYGSGYVQPEKFRGTSAKPPKPQSAATVALRAHQVLGPSSSITPTDMAVALQEQGMDMVEPFAPGTPLVPYYGYGRRPRAFNYETAYNVKTEVRPNRIPFETLDQLYKSYDIAQICTRHAINSIRSMLPLRFGVPAGYEGRYPKKEVEEVQKRLRRPDGHRLFRNWLAMNMLDLWKFDSAPIYRLRDKAGNVTKLQNVSAKTISPNLDYFGEIPDGDAPAFQQTIMGVPWDWLKWSDIIYEPFWPETESPYGTPPLETCLVNANTDVRLQLYFMQFFTSGSVPEAFAIAPEGMTGPDDIADFEEEYKDYFDGDQSQRWGLHWLPNDTELVFYKPQMFDPDLAEYVMRRTVAAYLETPHNLGFTDDVNRASGDTQMDVQFRITDLPTTGYYQDLLNAVIADDWNLPVEVSFQTGKDREDRLIEAQAMQIYWSIGAIRNTEIREKLLGYPVDPEEQGPLGIMDNRLGWMPYRHAIAVGGEVDPFTGMPKAGTVPYEDYVLPGSPAEDEQGGQSGTSTGGRPKARGKGSDPTKTYPQPLAAHRRAAKAGLPDEQTSDGRTPQALLSGARVGAPGYGVLGDPDAEQRDLSAWRRQSRNRVKQGKTPRRFESDAIVPERHSAVWEKLDGATSLDEVDSAFKAAQAEAAGVVVQAHDTGRVLMVQRKPDKHDPKEAYARWEFPGGCLDHEGDTPWSGARREWEEETGSKLRNFEHVGNWTSPDGVYQGFVVMVPSERDVELHPQEEEVSDARWWSKGDLDDPKVRDKVTDTLDRITPMLKGWSDEPRSHRGTFSTHQTLEWHGHHLHTDTIVDHYAPIVEAAMAEVFDPADIDRALAAAYRKVTPQQAHYTDATVPGINCGTCRFMNDDGSCDLVEGLVDKEHVCAFFQPALEKAQQNPSGRGAGLPPNQAAALAAGGVVGAGAGAGAAVAAAAPGLVGAAGAGGAALGAGAAAFGIVAAIAILAAARRSVRRLREVLTQVYGDAYTQGAISAASASNGHLPPWIKTVEVPTDYIDHWTPGVGEKVSAQAQGSLSQILRDRDIWIKEITDTEVDRIGEAIAQSVENGRPLSEARAAIDAIVHDAKRSWMIAETEYARASTLARRDTYRINGVRMVRWLHQPGACPACMANAEVSPLPLNARWPSGDVPVHPHCRCVEAPYIATGRPS